jgi:hypothetical protein
MLSIERVADEIQPVFASVFAFMEIAEDVISEKISDDPKNADIYSSHFLALRPSDEFTSGRWHDDVYRRHCEEILDRAVIGGDLRYPTKAEILVVLSKISEKTPLNSAATSLYSKLFLDLFGKIVDGMVVTESYSGELDETFSTFYKSKQLYQDWRVL